MSEVGGVAADMLKQFIERIERVEQEKLDLGADLREIYAKAKAAGFDNKVMRQIIKIRKMEDTERDEQETLMEVYKKALGML